MPIKHVLELRQLGLLGRELVLVVVFELSAHLDEVALSLVEAALV
eukprot:CAMPEP_0202107270 /NCGR_PEP_ID=MMETSP0965-20130614/15580_1 /ASSEMBLY_ACC=CAM_ASM_000507 /TAXON_ID=4773 /ORGANISM="Schizochytrium aggregatum, Strain ATCC28209" /LENGTH=44 /DNA_ID= /DNA_START= /DNA_END= /DNA_ORIENTATION=